MTNTLDAEYTTLKTIGYFDGIIDGHAHGWAYHPQHPNSRLMVEILCDGEVIGYGKADQFRSDLAPAGIGDGHYMYSIPLSYELYNSEQHTLTAREASTSTFLRGGPHVFGPENKNTLFEPISRAEGMEIFAEQLTHPQYKSYSSKKKNFLHAYRLASTMQECGNLGEALDAWNTIARALGDNVLCHCKIGENYLLQNNYAEALESFRAAVVLDFKSYWSHFGLSTALRLSGQFIEAEDELQVSIGLNPQSDHLRKLLKELQAHTIPLRLNALLSTDQQDAAIALLKSRLTSDPLNTYAAKKLDELTHPKNQQMANLPGVGIIHELERQQRLLELWLDDAETILKAKSAH